MAFYTEPDGYQKTALSDLQGAWECFRDTVVRYHPFPDSDRILFHIDEGMGWESVRDFNIMFKALLLIKNIVSQNEVPDEIIEDLENLQSVYDEVQEALRHGEIK